MIETVLVKRRALYQGEVGFFPTTPDSQADVGKAVMDAEVVCSFYSPKNLQQLKFLWALVSKVADNSSRYLDKDEAMDDLKLRAGFARLVVDKVTNEISLRTRSIKQVSNEELIALTSKIIDIVCRDLMPGMKANDLRKEIEEMTR